VALEHLLATLERDAEADAAAALHAVRAEGERIAAETAARLWRQRERRRAAAEAELRGATERAVAEVRHRTRAEVLEARRRFLDRVFAAATAALGEAARLPALLERLPADLAEARAYLGEGRIRVRCRPALAERLGGLARGDPALSIEPDPEAGTGVRLVAEDESVEVDHTLETRLAHMGPVLALEVLRLAQRPA
jgi:vacuolar-type H+-ATPase subunit E/Vma4